ncbi:mechanosensitive ion channel [bacterium]|nr:mechanosensitive ion channel [bacterium]
MFESLPHFLAKMNTYMSHELIKIGDVSLTLQKIAIALFSVWFFSKLSRAVERALHRALMKKDFDPGAKASIERFARYGVFTIGIIITLSYVGVNLRTLETFGAVLGVGIGFGLQNITQNFISGLILLTERPIKRGDLVVIDGVAGRVLDIRARSTLVLTRDDVVIIVPNSEFITKQVINQSFSGEKIRYAINVGVAYGSDTEKVKSVLLAAAQSHPQVLKTPPPSVQFKDFGASSLDFIVQVWLSELWFHEIILSEIRFEIEQQFSKNNIEIPFQQMDIHVRTMAKEKRP